MDPNATLAIMLDECLDIHERSQAACNLLSWLLRGGFRPIDDAGWTWNVNDVSDYYNLLFEEGE